MPSRQHVWNWCRNRHKLIVSCNVAAGAQGPRLTLRGRVRAWQRGPPPRRAHGARRRVCAGRQLIRRPPCDLLSEHCVQSRKSRRACPGRKASGSERWSPLHLTLIEKSWMENLGAWCLVYCNLIIWVIAGRLLKYSIEYALWTHFLLYRGSAQQT